MTTIFIFFLLFYCLIKNINIEYTFNKVLDYTKLTVLTYNIQRLPFMFRPTMDIKELMKKYEYE